MTGAPMLAITALFYLILAGTVLILIVDLIAHLIPRRNGSGPKGDPNGPRAIQQRNEMKPSPRSQYMPDTQQVTPSRTDSKPPDRLALPLYR